MRRTLSGFLFGLAVMGAVGLLTPVPAIAQSSCRDAAIYWWDLGWAPLNSAFAYLDGPVDPFSAEWSYLDCGFWGSGGPWDEGYGGWYYPRWDGRAFSQVWKAHRAKDTAFRVARLEPMQLAGKNPTGQKRPAKATPRVNRLGKAPATWTGYSMGGDASVASPTQGMVPSAGSFSTSGGVTVSPGTRKSR